MPGMQGYPLYVIVSVWAVTIVGAVTLVAFAAYFGDTVLGLMREQRAKRNAVSDAGIAPAKAFDKCKFDTCSACGAPLTVARAELLDDKVVQIMHCDACNRDYKKFI